MNYQPTYIGEIELSEETLAHYGVMGMRWGVRKDLRKTGSVSKKTKAKIKKSLSKASYGKHRRMLNTAEQLKSDYKGEIEYGKRKGYKQHQAKNSRNLGEVNAVSNMIKKSAGSKGYKYDVSKTPRMTRRNQKAMLIGDYVAGVPGYLLTGAATKYADRHYRERTNSKNSEFWTYDTDKYKKKK